MCLCGIIGTCKHSYFGILQSFSASLGGPRNKREKKKKQDPDSSLLYSFLLLYLAGLSDHSAMMSPRKRWHFFGKVPLNRPEGHIYIEKSLATDK